MRLEPLVPQMIASGRLIVDCELGRVFSPNSNAPKRQLGATTKKGYTRICISINGKQYHAFRHRVIWCATYGPVPEGKQIDHVNGVKSDDRLENLQCVTGDENMKRAAKNGLTNGGWRDGVHDPKTGQFIGKARAGRRLDGREWKEMPG